MAYRTPKMPMGSDKPLLMSTQQFQALLHTMTSAISARAPLNAPENLDTPQASTTTRSKAADHIKLKTFSGNTREDVNAWLFAFNIWEEASGVSEDKQLIAIVSSYLTKNALAWFQAWAHTNENAFSSWDNFVKDFSGLIYRRIY
ncbi:hypothetical protein BB561_002856 [Smittium simulii]|uniref:Ty3 transposon capsid-like protein domain-containing protein n=1 Tax=Smittium simulii TaxID=133385 RepID=A0A2T9YNS4_9FUNG|nr:hypothetical protein BB561_002856 [Smittium simulii]